KSKHTKAFPSELYRAVRRKLLYLHEADNLTDLRVPPGNRLEALKGNFKGFYSIRINDQWRIICKWSEGGPSEVKVLDYHK
ncbi:MAG: type II toxin-antitoxin system RelE/ParE family toxin, partial [Bdellovibrionales bacterium]|nr:type II toxin-antitoxin system RelE/ParE family toxin [Bdellovibrionales bacterium]